jgi:hypothetical protein
MDQYQCQRRSGISTDWPNLFRCDGDAAMKLKKTTRGLRLYAWLVSVALLATVPMAGQTAPEREQAPAVTPKPTAPIGISHRFASPPQVGQPLEVILSITADADLSQVNVQFGTDDPLAMIDPIDGVGLSPLIAGDGADVAVTVLPLIDQTHYLSVSVTAVIDGVAQTRSVAVPIRLPGSDLRKAEAVPTGNNQERVRSFQAIETVR